MFKVETVSKRLSDVCVYFSRAATTNWAESTSDTTSARLQSHAGHTQTAATHRAQELPYLSINSAAPDR